MKPTTLAACALLAFSAAACAREGAAPSATATAPTPAATGTPTAPAADNDDRARRRLERLDTDKDGRVSLAEFSAKQKPRAAETGSDKPRRSPEEQFRRRDKNSDGFLTAEELGGRERKGGGQGGRRGERDAAAAEDVAVEDEAL